ncbi:uncharacterized protein LOC135493192 [Lineus longissimus]|uniref:uncharacterized protein LOC135493192 n=1 Tax=Lineus longissimus TaxID=88925 RepID=UPI00315DB450
MMRYIWFVSYHNSTLIITTFALEKCIVVWKPLKRSTLITRGRRRVALLGIFATSLIMWTIGPITHEVVDDNSPMKVCVYDLTKMPRWLIAFFQLEVQVVHTLPSFIIMLSGILLIIGIQRSRDSVKTNSQTGHKTRRAESRCLVNLIALTINFLTFIGPNVIAWCVYIIQYYSYGTADPLVVSVAWLTTSLVQGNYSLNVVLYMCFLPFFREELAIIVRGRCKRTKI